MLGKHSWVTEYPMAMGMGTGEKSVIIGTPAAAISWWIHQERLEALFDSDVLHHLGSHQNEAESDELDLDQMV